MYLVPEVGQYLHDNALAKVQQAIAEYSSDAPYWFVSGFDSVYGEGATSPLYTDHTLFQARALIQKDPFAALAPYIDAPGVAIGDLYYIDNLISAIDAGG